MMNYSSCEISVNTVRKEFIKLFEELGFKIIVVTNLCVVNFIDINLDLDW